MNDKSAVKFLKNYSPIVMLEDGGFIVVSMSGNTYRKTNVRDFKSHSATPFFFPSGK